MTDNHSDSVYHAPEHPGPEGPQRPLRAFFVDVYDEVTGESEHAYYGVERPAEGEAVARTMHGNGLHLLGDIQAFADRIDGRIIWV